MSTEKKVAKGNVQTSVIIPLEFQWNNEPLSDLYDIVYNQLKLMGWQIPGSDRKEVPDPIKNKQNDNEKQRKYLITSSQYILHGMSATFQNVWTDFTNQRFTVRIFDSLKYKEEHSSHTKKDSSKFQVLCKASKMKKSAPPILCDLMDVQLYFTPFVMSYLVIRLRNATPIDPQYFIHTVRSENCEFFHRANSVSSNVQNYLFEQGDLSNDWNQTVAKSPNALTSFIHSIVPDCFKLMENQTYYKHQTTVTSFESEFGQLFYKMLGWADASRPAKQDYSQEFFASGHKPFQSTESVQFFQRLDGSKIAMAREGTVYHIRNSCPSESELSKVNLHHGRYLLIHLQAVLQSDILQYFNVETTKFFFNQEMEQTALAIEQLFRKLQHFEHWMPEDIGGSSFTIAYHEKLVQLYKIQEMRTDLRSTIQMLSNQYTILTQRERENREGPFFRFVGVLLGVTAFLSLPSYNLTLGYVGWAFAVVLMSIFLFMFADRIMVTLLKSIEFLKKVLS